MISEPNRKNQVFLDIWGFLFDLIILIRGKVKHIKILQNPTHHILKNAQFSEKQYASYTYYWPLIEIDLKGMCSKESVLSLFPE